MSYIDLDPAWRTISHDLQATCVYRGHKALATSGHAEPRSRAQQQCNNCVQSIGLKGALRVLRDCVPVPAHRPGDKILVSSVCIDAQDCEILQEAGKWNERESRTGYQITHPSQLIIIIIIPTPSSPPAHHHLHHPPAPAAQPPSAAHTHNAPPRPQDKPSQH